MDFQSLLAEAQSLGAIFAWGEHGQVKVRAPTPLPVEFVEELKKHKPKIMDLLRGRDTPVISYDRSASSGLNEEDAVNEVLKEEERRG